MPIKIVAFDLSIEALGKFYDHDDYTYAYRELGNFFHKHGFEHKQYSGYISQRPMSDIQIIKLMDELAKELPWIGFCAESVMVTDKPKNYMEFNKALNKLSRKYYKYANSDR